MWTVLPDAVFCDRRPCNAALEEFRSTGERPAKASRPATVVRSPQERKPA